MTATSSTPSTPSSRPAPADVVRSFLLALQDGDLGGALGYLAEDVRYVNVSLPTIRGRRGVERTFRPLMKRLPGRFRVHFHAVATDGDVVLTERTDGLILGRVEHRFWVYGRFEVEDGLITLWQDSFDWGDVIVGLVRGLAGAVVPALNRPWPGALSPSHGDPG